MSKHENRISLKQITVEIPAVDLLSCIWYSDGSEGLRLGGIGLESAPEEWIVWLIQTLDDRPDIVRIILVPPKEDGE